MAEEPMDVEAVLEGLNEALALELRGAVELTLAAGAATGMAYVGLAGHYRAWAVDSLADAGRIVDKIVGLGGAPEPAVAEPRFDPDPEKMARRLLASEDEATETLRQVIKPAGDEARGEALEHLLEHLILRKQDQADFLRRALGES